MQIIRALGFLFLASVVFADTQKCDNGDTYYSYVGDLQQGTDQYFQCLQNYLNETGISQGKPVKIVENPAISALQWKLSPYQENTGCSNCLNDCQNASADPNQVCKITSNNGPIIVPQPVEPVDRLALFRIKIVIRIGPVTITITWGR